MKTRRKSRSGNVLVLTAVMMLALIAIVALAVDLGYIQVVRTQMQVSADAAAMAATWELIDTEALTGIPDPYAAIERVYSVAGQFSAENAVSGASPILGYEDIEIGYIEDPAVPEMDFSDPAKFNAVRVRIRRTPEQNGEVALFFARAVGIDSYAGQTEATAVFLGNISGFRWVGENMGILPFAFDQTMWDDLIGGTGDDNFSANRVWNEETGEVEWDIVPGSDGIREINLFPQDVGAPGNFGTIDIGADNNSTQTLRRQIEVGLTEGDMSHYSGSMLMIDPETGVLSLPGDTGISAGMESALESVIGLPRIVPLYGQVAGNGSNTVYDIVKFVGVRVLEVDLSGGLNTNKRLILQPANVTIPGVIRATVTDPINPDQWSQFVYSPVWLIR